MHSVNSDKHSSCKIVNGISHYIQANHPRFSCTSNMSLTIYGIIFSGPLMHTDTPSGTGVLVKKYDIFSL